MTEQDRVAFTQAFINVCAQQGQSFDAHRCKAYFEARLLRDLPVAGVIDAMERAVALSGRFLPEVGLIEQVYQEGRRAGRGQVKFRAIAQCPYCDGTGWAYRIAETGVVLDLAAFREWERFEKPTTLREDGRPHYATTRCACRQAVAS